MTCITFNVCCDLNNEFERESSVFVLELIKGLSTKWEILKNNSLQVLYSLLD